MRSKVLESTEGAKLSDNDYNINMNGGDYHRCDY